MTNSGQTIHQADEQDMHVVIDSTEASRTVCRLSGALDWEHAAQLGAALAACGEAANLAVDLSDVSFMDSAGLRVLVGGVRRVHYGGGEVVVCGARPNIRRLLELTGFDRVAPLEAEPVTPGPLRTVTVAAI